MSSEAIVEPGNYLSGIPRSPFDCIAAWVSSFPAFLAIAFVMLVTLSRLRRNVESAITRFGLGCRQ